MKTANEMAMIASQAIEKRKAEQYAKAVDFCEGYVQTKIDDAAANGKSSVKLYFATIDANGVDYFDVKNFLISNYFRITTNFRIGFITIVWPKPKNQTQTQRR